MVHDFVLCYNPIMCSCGNNTLEGFSFSVKKWEECKPCIQRHFRHLIIERKGVFLPGTQKNPLYNWDFHIILVGKTNLAGLNTDPFLSYEIIQESK